MLNAGDLQLYVADWMLSTAEMRTSFSEKFLKLGKCVVSPSDRAKYLHTGALVSSLHEKVAAICPVEANSISLRIRSFVFASLQNPRM